MFVKFETVHKDRLGSRARTHPMTVNVKNIICIGGYSMGADMVAEIHTETQHSEGEKVWKWVGLTKIEIGKGDHAEEIFVVGTWKQVHDLVIDKDGMWRDM
jgi:hypothetical protein